MNTFKIAQITEITPKYHPVYVSTSGQVLQIIDRVANWFELIIFAIAVVVLIAAGAMYVTAGGDEEKAKKARKLITYALIGIAIVLLAWGGEALVKSFLTLPEK